MKRIFFSLLLMFLLTIFALAERDCSDKKINIFIATYMDNDVVEKY